MKVYVIEQHEYNEDTNLYDICNGSVEVFADKGDTERFIDQLSDSDREEGFDYAYFIKTFEL